MIHSDPPISNIGGADRVATRLEQHRSNLDQIHNSIERACIQYEDMLCKLRGNQPETSTDHNKVAQEPAILDSLDYGTEAIMGKVEKLNNMADELRGYI